MPLTTRRESPSEGAGGPPLRPAAEPPVPAGHGVVRAAAGVLLVALIVAGLYLGREILIPLALAILLGFVLGPAVTRLRRWGLPHLLSVIAVVALALALLGGSFAYMANEVRDLSTELPTYQQTIKRKLSDLRQAIRAPGMFDGLTRTVTLVQREASNIAEEAAARSSGPARVQKVEIVGESRTPLENALDGLERVASPLLTAGIVLVFTFLILLDRLDLRDRLIRLVGGNLHRATDAMDEAGQRISSYLIVQLWVNLSYGVPMALGLWLIGVPGAFLWGAVAALMRYVPYVGPMISALFPLALAFAVDPGWSTLLWTLGLIVVLELISNNIVEPWLYGSSTGLSAISLIVAATFWTALWGPVGLVMSTPLTVCLLVVGRHLPGLQFFNVMLGSAPALDAPTRLYQRLLSGDVDEAVELGRELAQEAASLPAFYQDSALPVLRQAVADYQTVSTTEHRLRVITGMEALLDELHELAPASSAPATATAVLCLGAKWEVDTLAARMLAHALSLEGTPARADTALANHAPSLAGLDGPAPHTVCLSLFAPEPWHTARRACRRIQRRWPQARVVVCAWNIDEQALTDPALLKALDAHALAGSLVEAVLRAQESLGVVASEWEKAPLPPNEAQRAQQLRTLGALDEPALRELFEHTAQRAASIFDVSAAMVTVVTESELRVLGFHGALRGSVDGQDVVTDSGKSFDMPREYALCGHVVARDEVLLVPDIAKDARFAANPRLRGSGLRFYAGAPLRMKRGGAIGSLCLLDTEPRQLSERDLKLLQAMAQDLMEAIARRRPHADIEAADATGPDEAKSSATVGQVVPDT